METVVNNYRGYEIRFNCDSETFICDIDNDRSVKKSYSSLKKFIDDYLKENSNFKPFKVTGNPLRGNQNKDGIIIGIRKDGRPVIQLPNGKQQQVSDWDLNDYVLSSTVNEKEINKLRELEIVEKQAETEVTEFKKTMTLKTLRDYKKQLEDNG